MVTAATFFSPLPASRCGRSVMTEPNDAPTSEAARPAEVLPEVYADLRRPAAALTAQLRLGSIRPRRGSSACGARPAARGSGRFGGPDDRPLPRGGRLD